MISCSDYDYIEIVCLYHYPICLVMKSGDIINGTALDTQRNEDRVECIKISSDDTEVLVILDDIAMLKVCVGNPHFNEVYFS